ncbi:uncharacterized protein TNCV_4885441 [Trichonephila clavipes]|nr:uncharacterized protein TNCV_4885441 [Trichonephila clavipes]
MLIYEFPSSSLRCRANPNLFRRSFEPFDQMLYHRMVLEPHTAYPIPAGTRYILLTVQKTMFGLQATTSDPGSCTGRDKQKGTLEQQPEPLSQKKRVIITPIIRPSVPPVMIIKPSTALSTPQPVSIPEPPEQTTPQILLPDPPRGRDNISDSSTRSTCSETTPSDPFYQIHHLSRQHLEILLPDPPVVETTSQILLPDPPSKQTTPQILLPDPPVVETLEPTLTDDSSIDQIMSSVFGDYLQQGIPSAHIQEPQKNSLIFCPKIPSLETRACKKWFRYNTCWTSVDIAPLLSFGNLGRWPDRVTYYEPDYPYTILFEPNFGVHIPRSFGKTVIVFTSHLDLTWDQGVELRFFQVGRPHSHRVWEAYQPQTTDAYSVDLTDCPRVADVYVKWLTWLDDWEMHRDDPVPWRIVGLQPWKQALEQHVQRSHEKALAHGMPSDVTLLDHI